MKKNPGLKLKARENPGSKLKPRRIVAPNKAMFSKKHKMKKQDRKKQDRLGWKKRSKTNAKYKCHHSRCKFFTNTENKLRVHCNNCKFQLGNYTRRRPYNG